MNINLYISEYSLQNKASGGQRCNKVPLWNVAITPGVNCDPSKEEVQKNIVHSIRKHSKTPMKNRRLLHAPYALLMIYL